MTARARPNGVLGTTEVPQGVQDQVIELIRQGNYFSTAAEAGGMRARTFFLWMEKGEADVDDEVESRYANFYTRVKEAEAEAEHTVVAAWMQHIPDDWKAASTFLARRAPERWGANRESNQDAGTGQIVINIGHRPSNQDMRPSLADEDPEEEDTDDGADQAS